MENDKELHGIKTEAEDEVIITDDDDELATNESTNSEIVDGDANDCDNDNNEMTNSEMTDSELTTSELLDVELVDKSGSGKLEGEVGVNIGTEESINNVNELSDDLGNDCIERTNI